jgi:hypothetical protein
MIEGRGQKAESRSRRGLWLSLLLLSAFCLLPSFAAAQDQYVPIVPIPLGDTLLSLPTSHIPTEGTWEVKFTHRFNQSLDQGSLSDRVHSLWGLDSNADVAFGASWTVRPDFQLSLLRSNAMDDVELAAKYVVVQQAPAVPFSVALRVGGDWRTERDLNDRGTAFAQLVLSRQLGRHVEIFVIPTYATDAGRVVVGQQSQALFKHAGNVPVGIAVQIHGALSIVGEVIPKNRDLPSGLKADPAWALGLKRAIGGHYFEILVTNSNATTVDQYVSSTYQGSALNKSDFHIGFNIERRFGGR